MKKNQQQEQHPIYLVTWTSRHGVAGMMKTDDLDRAFQMAKRNGGTVTVIPQEEDDDQIGED